jgi:mgtE-like transporter
LLSGFISMLAGLTIQGRLNPLLGLPALFVVIPPLLSLSGSLPGILSSRLATKLHLGLIEVRRGMWRGIVEDIMLVYVYATAIFLVLGCAVELLSVALSLKGPSALTMLGVALVAGLLATTWTNFIGYFGAVATYRYGLDPDNFGIPLVSGTSDLLGAIALILSLVIFRIT